MVPQVIKMVEAEDPARIEAFVRKTAGLCAYILGGEGASLVVEAAQMPREDGTGVTVSEEEVGDGEPNLAEFIEAEQGIQNIVS